MVRFTPISLRPIPRGYFRVSFCAAFRQDTHMNRKQTSGLIVILVLGIVAVSWLASGRIPANAIERGKEEKMNNNDTITLFLCGDVMVGRGIDQVLPHSSKPELHELYVRDARRYVELAGLVNRPLIKPVDPAYIWGDALAVLAEIGPELRIINLETSITTSDEYWPKGINYRMHPQNSNVLTTASIDCCVLANNHVLDWGHKGLVETLETLEKAGIKQAGAGRNHTNSSAPAIFEIPGRGRVLIFAYGSATSGIVSEWAATEAKPGINLLPDLSISTVQQIQKEMAAVRQQGDIVLVSLHWGDNWGYNIPTKQRRFAHWLIDQAGVDLIHGHSSHHVKGIEVYRNKLILYGCGDFLNDYEGIGGYEQFRDDLTLMYFPRISVTSGRLEELRMVPMQIKNFQTVRPALDDIRWLHEVLNRQGAGLNTGVRLKENNSLSLFWAEE
jgi:poly-gamma-glutamate capsule biosynthesis protein CapA/YwtB (metallophosphatase superfamily)